MPLLEGTPDPAIRTGGRCSVGNVLQALEEPDRAKLEEWLWAKNAVGDWLYTGLSIANRLTDAGFPMAGHSVNRHRRKGGCRCGS